jgi:dienelactone hydrolase
MVAVGEVSLDYDPFLRGLFPVGVRSGQAVDEKRDNRPLPFEVWYPAADHHAGLDLDPKTGDTFSVLPDTPALQQAAVRDAAVHRGSYPLILFSHTSAGHRRQSSFLCTHLASHGYVVAGVDHTGNTNVDATERARRRAAGAAPTPAELDAYVQQIIADRVPDLRLLLDRLLAGAAGDVSEQIDGRRLGLIGWSFGGWAVLATPEVDDRFGAVVALAPAGNSRPLPGIIPVTLTFAWRREAPTLLLAAEDDRDTPLPGIYELLERTPSRKGLFILRQAEHGHFGDQIDDEERCPREQAHLFTRGLALAHLDATLKDSHDAQQFMAGDPVSRLRERGVDALAYSGGLAGPLS